MDGPADGERPGVAVALARKPEATERIKAKARDRDHDNLAQLRHHIFSILAQECPRPKYPKGHPKAGQWIKRKGG